MLKRSLVIKIVDTLVSSIYCILIISYLSPPSQQKNGDPGASKPSLREVFPPGVASINLKQVLDLCSPPTAGELKFASHLTEYQNIK